MCGIWTSVGATGGKQALARMAHRGPDGEGLACLRIADTQVEMAHRRLAVIDPEPRSNQPMTWEDDRFYIVFNGVIYNYLELRTELESLGLFFNTDSDTEVLLAAFAHWGEAVMPRLVGMFAFVILDRRQKELFVARDPFGIKPLYHSSTPYGLVFCSEIGPLLDYPGVSRRVNPAALYRYALYGITDGHSQTLFQDIENFPAGHMARIRLDTEPVVRPERYWTPMPAPDGRSFAEAAGILQERFLESISLHLRADVPIGTALSGGIDSSSVISAMRRIGGPGFDFRTFSFVAPGHDFDESRWIEAAAKAAGAQCFTISMTSDELIRDLDDLIMAQGEPFGSTSVYAQFRVMQLAHSNGIKVILDGQGADEIFGGYRFYLTARLAELLAAGKVGAALKLMRRVATLPDVDLSAIGLGTARNLLPNSLIPLGRRLAGKPLVPDWMDKTWLSANGVRPAENSRSGYSLHDHLIESIITTVLPALLRYEDRNSMRFSIESRVPFLTTALVEAALACPAEYLIDERGTTKAVFRAAMRGIVPEALLNRRDKVGFTTPEKSWLQSQLPWVRTVLSSDRARDIPLFRPRRLNERFESMLAGDKPMDFQCWRWLNLIRWADIFDVQFD